MQDASHPAPFRRPRAQFLASCLAPVREYRLHISIPGLEMEMPDEWKSLMRFLEQRHADLAPRVTWDAAHLAVVSLSLDTDSEARAVRLGIDAVSDALHQTGLGGFYPQGVDIEQLNDFIPAGR